MTIKELRLKKGLKPSQLALKIGVNEREIRRWERGDSIPHGRNLIALAEEFGPAVYEVFSQKKEPA